MAIDNTPPRLKLIVTIAAITVVTLISLDFVFKSYYGYMSDLATREKLAPTTDLDNHKKAEAASLTAAKIADAMNAVAKGQRPEPITPQPSDDTTPLVGWTKLPHPVPTAEPTLKLEPTPAPTALAGDGGAPAAATADGGGAPITNPPPVRGDAGAPRH